MSGPKDPPRGAPQGSLFARRRSAAPPAQGPGGVGAGGVTLNEPRPLWIGAAERAAIKGLMQRAEGRRVPIAEMRRRVRQLQSGHKLPNYNRELTIEIPFGFAATYSIEEQPVGWTRHLSVSVDRPGRAPHPEAVLTLMSEFGFRAKKFDQLDAAWLEELGNDRKAINLVEPIGEAVEGARPGALLAPELPDEPLMPVSAEGEEQEDE